MKNDKKDKKDKEDKEEKEGEEGKEGGDTKNHSNKPGRWIRGDTDKYTFRRGRDGCMSRFWG